MVDELAKKSVETLGLRSVVLSVSMLVNDLVDTWVDVLESSMVVMKVLSAVVHLVAS